jgi:TP901-1 family phage major tail protein
MRAQKGSLVLLKLKQNDKFVAIGGMRTTKFILNNKLIDASNIESGTWRELLEGSGISFVTITGEGIFTNSESEQIFKTCAFNNEIKEYELIFGNGERLIGKFHISSYERSGNHGEEETYSLMLESTGPIKFN